MPITNEPKRPSKSASSQLVRRRHGSAGIVRNDANNANTPSIHRKLSAPELPPIGIRLARSPSNQDITIKPIETETRINGTRIFVPTPPTRPGRSTLSPSSTSTASTRSVHYSPNGAINVPVRSTTWSGELPKSQNGSGKLETLYETTVNKASEINVNNRPGSLPPHRIDNNKTHVVVYGNVTEGNVSKLQITKLTSAQQINDANNNKKLENKHGLPGVTAISQLTANKLSQNNLQKLRDLSIGDRVQSGTQQGKKAEVADEDFDTDDEKEHRIVQWLIGVESQSRGPPEIKELETTEKRDTAIHIVYNGD